MSTHTVVLQILTEVTNLIAQNPALSAYANMPDKPLPYAEQEPNTLPVVTLLADMAAQCSPDTQALAQAIIDGADHLRWQHSYSADQVGEPYLKKYGWFNLISPDGPFVSTELRVSIGVWGQGLYYPEHWHEPQEKYCVLAGGAKFMAKGRAPRYVKAGGIVYHESNQPHAMDMKDSPLLALAIWRGGALTRPSHI
jgi:quercetin dioxygenase-like cupin family protein